MESGANVQSHLMYRIIFKVLTVVQCLLHTTYKHLNQDWTRYCKCEEMDSAEMICHCFKNHNAFSVILKLSYGGGHSLHLVWTSSLTKIHNDVELASGRAMQFKLWHGMNQCCYEQEQFVLCILSQLSIIHRPVYKKFYCMTLMTYCMFTKPWVIGN